MKRITLLAFLLLASLANLMAQVTTPQGFNYQAVVRNSSGQIIVNGEVNLRLTILQGSPNGAVVYSYNNHVQTNQNGVITVVVGGNSDYQNIDWSYGPFYLKSEIDPNNGNNFNLSTTQQLLSVPYAHHADVADHVSEAFTYDERDPEFKNWFRSWAYEYDSLRNTPTRLSQFINDLGFLTANDMDLSISGDTLFINGGDYVILPPTTTSLPWDSIIGHPTNLSQFVNDLNLSDFNNDLNLSDFNNDLSLGDFNNNMSLSDFTNDMSLSDFQNDLNFTVRGDTLFLDNNTFVVLPHNLVDSLDWNKIYNEPTYLSQFINDLGLSDFNNDIMFSISGDTIFFGDNNKYIVLPHNLADSLDWSRIINHPTRLSEFTNDLNLSDFNNDMNLSDFNNDLNLSSFVNDLSLSDFQNDLNFSVSGDTLFLNDTTFVVLPHNLVDSLDWNIIYNEPTKLSQFINDLNLSDFNNDMSLSQFTNDLNLSDFNNDLSLSDFQNDLNFSVSGDTLFLNDTVFVTLPHNLVDSLDWNIIFNEPTKLSQFINDLNLSDFNNDLGLSDFQNDISFTISNDTIFFGDSSNFVVLPHDLADSLDWSRVVNHPTNLSQFNNDLNLSDLNNDMNLSDFNNDLSLSDFQNDLNFSVSGDTLFLNDTVFVKLPHNLVDSLDWNIIFNEPTKLSQFINDLNLSDFNNDLGLSDFQNDISFTISNDTIFFGDSSNFVVLPHDLADSLDWSRVVNHPTNLSQFNNDLNLSDLNNDMNLSQFNNDMSLSDFLNDLSLSDFQNDLNFSVSGDTLFLNDTVFVKLPHNLVDSLDWNKIYNEPTKLSQFINDLNLSDFNNDLNLSDLNNDMSLSDFPNDLGYLTTETQGLSDVLSINNDASAGITNLPLPVNNRDAVNKMYADSVAAHEAQAVNDRLSAIIDSLANAIDSINDRNRHDIDSLMSVVDSLAHPTIEGCIPSRFSISSDKQVLFSKGNLQYNPRLDIFRFADNQYDAMTTENMWISESYNGWIDLFGYGTSGWKGGRSCFHPYETNTNDAMYMINSTGAGDDLTEINENADWGIYNRIINGSNTPGAWRTLTYSEWTYLLNDRANASSLKTLATVNNKRGLILLPDNWQTPAGVNILFTMTNYNDVTINASQWNILEQAGAIFLPAAGIRYSNTVTEHNAKGYYWSSSHNNTTTSRTLNIDPAQGASMEQTNCGRGCSVRLVRDY